MLDDLLHRFLDYEFEQLSRFLSEGPTRPNVFWRSELCRELPMRSGSDQPTLVRGVG